MTQTSLKASNKQLNLGLVLSDNDVKCSLKVAVRVRPFSKREQIEETNKCVIEMNQNETLVDLGKYKQSFDFDYSFWSFDKSSSEYATQKIVYEKIGEPLLSQILLGYNACLFAYGQTSTGKSYSMIGDNENEGIIPQFCKDLFDNINSISNRDINVTISYFEIYNENIYDLLKITSKKSNLRVREDPINGPYVVDLSSFPVQNFADILIWMDVGNKNRATAATQYNHMSSRSHSIFTITVTQITMANEDEQTFSNKIVSKMNLVDLAGNERLLPYKISDNRLRETANINKSLLTLGQVISALSSSGRRNFAPYRDSVLTWLLKESLGGNSKTSMIATISPSSICIDETMHTLRFAKQANSILNSAHINQDPDIKTINALRAEIDELKKVKILNFDNEKIQFLKNELSQKEKEIERLKKLWEEELKLSKQKIEESNLIAINNKNVISVSPRQLNLPNLINLNMDAQISELLVYTIKPGYTCIGSKQIGLNGKILNGRDVIDYQDEEQLIHLEGSKIAQEHCFIYFDEKIKLVKLFGKNNAEIFVNGNLVEDERILQHNDRIIFGHTHFFRFSYQSNEKKDVSSKSIYDFQYSYKELQDSINKKTDISMKELRSDLDKKFELISKTEASMKNLEKSIQAENISMQTLIQICQSKQKFAHEQSNKMKSFLMEFENNEILTSKPASSIFLNYVKEKKNEIWRNYGVSNTYINSDVKNITDLNNVLFDNELPYRFEIADDLIKVRSLNSEETFIIKASSLGDIKKQIVNNETDLYSSIKDLNIKSINPLHLMKINANVNCDNVFNPNDVNISEIKYKKTSFADNIIKIITALIYFIQESYNDIFEEENSNMKNFFSLSLNFELLSNSFETFISCQENRKSNNFSIIQKDMESLQTDVLSYFMLCRDGDKLSAYNLVCDLIKGLLSISQATGGLAIIHNMHMYQGLSRDGDSEFETKVKIEFLRGCNFCIFDNVESVISKLEECDDKLLNDNNCLRSRLTKKQLDFLIQTSKVILSTIIYLREVQTVENFIINQLGCDFEEDKSDCLVNSYLTCYEFSLQIAKQYRKIKILIFKIIENVNETLDEKVSSMIQLYLNKLVDAASLLTSPKIGNSNFKLIELIDESRINLLKKAAMDVKDSAFKMLSVINE